MNIVKIRKVGNSNVITLPRGLQELGFSEGAQIIMESTPEGELRLIPVNSLLEAIRASGRKVTREHRDALAMLAESEGALSKTDRESAVAD